MDDYIEQQLDQKKAESDKEESHKDGPSPALAIKRAVIKELEGY